MSLLNAFLATWSQARQTFGDGAPPPQTIDVPTDTPYGTVPSGLLTPNAGASNAAERSLPS